MVLWSWPISGSRFNVCALVVDLGAVVPVEVSHLRVHDALVGGGEHLG